MAAAMLGARAVEGAAVALLRLLLLLLPALSGPGLGVVGAAGAGLPESVIWAVNAGGEAHVDVHGIHFRKDPLEGRVGRGESPPPGRGSRACRAGAAGRGPSPSPSRDPGASSWTEVSLQFPQGPAWAQLTAWPWLEKPPRAPEAQSWRRVSVGPRRLPRAGQKVKARAACGTSRPRGWRFSRVESGPGRSLPPPPAGAGTDAQPEEPESWRGRTGKAGHCVLLPAPLEPGPCARPCGRCRAPRGW